MSAILPARFALASALLGTALLAACAVPKELVVESKRSPEASIPLGQVLVVIDYSLQIRAAPSAKGQEERLSKWYLPLGEIMSAEVVAAGGKPTVVYVAHSDERPTATAEHSHVWTQRITNLTATSQGGQVYLGDLSWQGSIAHRQARDRALVPAYDQRYSWRGGYAAASGVDCFHSAPRYAPREACIREFRELIAGQLRAYSAGPARAKAAD